VLLKGGIIFPAARVPTPAPDGGRAGARVVNDGEEAPAARQDITTTAARSRAVSSFETGPRGSPLPERQLRGMAGPIPT